MKERFKSAVKRHWPVMRLRTMIFGALLFVALLPAIGAVFLRVFENSVVRQTEAALIAQGAAIVVMVETSWPGASPPPEKPLPPPPRKSRYSSGDYASSWSDGKEGGGYYQPQPTRVDLSAMPILPPRPAATVPAVSAVPDALNLAALAAPFMAATSRKTLASIQMLDENGTVVAGYQSGKSYAHIKEVQSALAGKSVTLLRRNGEYEPRYYFEFLSRASGIRLHHARPIMAGDKVRGAMLITRSPRQLFQGLYQDLGKILIATALIFMVLIALTAILVRAIIRPVESLSRATRAVTAGQGFTAERPGLGVVEIRNLYDDFDMMAETIDRRSSYLRDFAASVAHEFKTPLSGLRGGIELLEDHGETMSVSERKQFLNNMTQDSERLSHLVQRLLEMAQADMMLTDPNARTNVKANIAQVADGFRGQDFAIDLGLPDNLPDALAPASTVEAVAATLIENSRQAGATHMGISTNHLAGHINIEFRDNGPGISAGDKPRVFDPFFTNKRSEGGTGLGLAIARALVQASKGEIILMESEEGACFRLILPAI